MNKSGNRLGKVAEFLLSGKFVLYPAITNAGGGELPFTACAAIQNFCEHPWSVFELVTLCVVELLLLPLLRILFYCWRRKLPYIE